MKTSLSLAQKPGDIQDEAGAGALLALDLEVSAQQSGELAGEGES